MQKIDSHQHFWKYDKVRDSWITDEMPEIKRDFFPEHLVPLLKENKFDGCIAVQADQSEEENKFLLGLATKNDFIKGIVGWIDLQNSNVHERLEYYSRFQIIKGFRHILQGEQQRDLMLNESFKNGISYLAAFNFTYDLLIFPDQLKYAKQLAEEFPEQKFVIDHLAKPPVITKETGEWIKDIRQISKLPNVFCKISGFVTEASWNSWKKSDFDPCFDVVVNAFGIERIMFGSDWPVCNLAASYKEVARIVEDYFSSFPGDEKAKVLGGNAIQFYNL